ncbi:MAG: hypothetical protein E7649_00255 [Ruminococcaceae bacterium]|nr:hypothetical protein [Oscillospiraceae bacterium]
MKKTVSFIIAVAMILSTLAVCILPASAAGDAFAVTIAREDLFDDIPEDDRKSVPGYIYADDGLRVNPLGDEYAEYRATWPNNTPYYTIQTADEESLMGGFYMEVRIDAFSGGDTTDRWFGFSIWDSQSVQLGQVGEDALGRDWGTGVETLIRVNSTTNKAERLQWYDDTETAGDGRITTRVDTIASYPNIYKEDADGNQILTIEIRFNSDEGLYEVLINDVLAPVEYCESLTVWLSDRNDKAYVGFSLQSAYRNGEASVTVTKVGTSKEDAHVPVGSEEDWVKAIQRDNEFSEVAAKDTVDEGEPAIHITGDPDSYKSFKSVAGGTDISITEDGSFLLKVSGTQADPLIRVKNDVSYDLKDFPYMFIMVKNLCTCVYKDHNYDGKVDPGCEDLEAIGLYYLAGEWLDGKFMGGVTFEKLFDLNETDSEGNTYSVFCLDMSDYAAEYEEAQRIHGFMLNFIGIKYEELGRNEFEIISLSNFATQEEGEAFMQAYYDDNLVLEEETTTPDEETTAPDEETTAPTEETTAPDEDTTAPDEETTAPDEESTAPDEETTAPDEETTVAPDEETTKAEDKETTTSKTEKPSDNDDGDDDKKSDGCGSVAGFGAMAIVAVAAIGLISFKKKED